MAYRLPTGMSFEEGAAIPVNYLTAYHSMFVMGNLQAGDRMLVHGAAGGVGIAAIQLAKAHGLVTFGTAGPTKQEYLRKIGVDHPIDYTKGDIVKAVRKFAPDGIEMAMDPIGGKSFAHSQACLGPTGDSLFSAFPPQRARMESEACCAEPKALLETPKFHPLKMMSENLTVIGVNLGALQARGALLRRELDELFRMYEAGKIKPVIGKSFPLADAAAAHRFIQERKNIGKVVLTVK